MPKYPLNNIEKLKKEKKDYLFNRALGYIALRSRSEKEIYDYLLKKSKFFPNLIFEKEVEEIVILLKEEGYIDDSKFISWWVESRSYFRPKSKIILVQELKKKGIGSELINNYFDDNQVDEVQLAKDIISKKIHRYKGLDRKNQFTKMMFLLTRAGFSYQVAKTAFEEFDQKM